MRLTTSKTVKIINFKKHVYIKDLKNKYVYELKYKIVRLKAQRTI